MARIDVAGFDAVERQLSRTLTRDMKRKVVEAGAAAAVRVMRERTRQAGHVRTGDMLESIAPSEYRDTLEGGEMVVYPQGTDRKGVANAMKAYVINYGRGKKTRRMGDKFITGNMRQVEAAIEAAMDAETERLLSEIER